MSEEGPIKVGPRDLLALGGILFVGDVEQWEVCVVFAFAKAGSGAPVMTLSVGVCVVGVPVELPDATGSDPSTAVGGFWIGAGATSSFSVLGIWITSSVPLLLRDVRFRWAGDVRGAISCGMNPFRSS